MDKAEQFFQAAGVVEALAGEGDDVGDAYITLCVHAGIAAADVVCCARLGEHAYGESHSEAVSLLAKVDRTLSRDLRTLLNMKTHVGYGHLPATSREQKQAARAAAALLDTARLVSSS